MTLIEILILFIVLCVVIYAVKLVLDMLELPPQVRTLIMLVIAVVVILIIISSLGLADGLTTRQVGPG